MLIGIFFQFLLAPLIGDLPLSEIFNSCAFLLLLVGTVPVPRAGVLTLYAAHPFHRSEVSCLNTIGLSCVQFAHGSSPIIWGISWSNTVGMSCVWFTCCSSPITWGTPWSKCRWKIFVCDFVHCLSPIIWGILVLILFVG